MKIKLPARKSPGSLEPVGLGGRLKAMKLLKAVCMLLALRVFCLSLWGQASSSAADSQSHQVSLRIIVVSAPEEAERIARRLKAGEDFAVLAKEKSSDPTADSGGYMGTLDPATLRTELKDALSDLAPGQTSPIVHIPEGYAILKVLSPYAAKELENASRDRLSALSGVGAIRYTPNVSGIGEAESALFRSPKPQGWGLDLREVCETRKQTLANATKRMEDLLAPSNAAAIAGQAPLDVTQEYYALGELYSYLGKMDRAIDQYFNAYKLAQSRVPEAAPQFEEELGIAHLHKSEVENGIYQNPDDRCLFPLRPGLKFSKQEDSRQAIQYFQKYLASVPGDLPAKWLLNYAYMTLGEYPSGVPKQYLIPASTFQSKEDAPHFLDVAAAAGLNEVSMAGGVIVDDFENNGLLDVVSSSMNMCEHMRYFHNNGDGTFTDRSEQAGLADQLGGLNIIQADYNNDGCMDILVMRGGWEIPMRKSLLKNNCNGTFTDVTREAGLADAATATQTAVWADINNDGLLDLFVGSENGPAQLFLNKGNGTFENISHSAGLDKVAFTKAVVSTDYDNDGYPDFYVSNYAGNNFLYHNNHDNTFTDVAQQAGVLGPWISFPTWFFDYDNDGWPDLFVSSYFISIDESVRTYLGLPHSALSMKLYHNQHDGTFKDVTAETGLDKVYMPMGANFGDIDNDGFLDIYLGNGNPSYGSLIPHVLLRNHGGKYFVDVTAASGTGEMHKGHGVAFADIDRRGNEDILTLTGGAVPGDSHGFRLFKNPGNGNDWINLKLVGVKSNRGAIGARIKVTVQNEAQGTRSIYRTVGSGGSFGASPLEQHIGLGWSARIENIEIWWPASNTKQEFPNVAKNQFLQITEFADTYNKLDRKPVRLGGAKREEVAPERASHDGGSR
jgi:tetratricopeptide (TPR) repeat protein